MRFGVKRNRRLCQFFKFSLAMFFFFLEKSCQDSDNRPEWIFTWSKVIFHVVLEFPPNIIPIEFMKWCHFACPKKHYGITTSIQQGTPHREYKCVLTMNAMQSPVTFHWIWNELMSLVNSFNCPLPFTSLYPCRFHVSPIQDARSDIHSFSHPTRSKL